MALTGGSTPYYIHSVPPFRSITNPQVQTQSEVQSTFSIETKSPGFPHGINISMPSGASSSEPVKKKRGRPRKYAPEGQMSLGLLPMPTKSKASSESDASGQKKNRGRPPGSGRKQQLALLGEWMYNSAGQAFAPHVVTIGAGEDIVAKMLAFAQQRPRAICIMSGSGTVSSVTLRQPASTTPSVTYEGRFEILCLSGSFLVAEEGGPRNRTGGISVSLSTPDGQVLGGGAASLVAASPVQLVICSFVYGGSKAKNKQLSSPRDNKDSSVPQSSNNLATPTSAPPIPNYAPVAMSAWTGSRQVDLRNPHADIDLTRG